ncbi:MAG: hypothetical protein M1822_001583 [Bathelium mastoideum]|nr:MAG: hypothetical protein M1822_001583 [Bathelium mastoideum]
MERRPDPFMRYEILDHIRLARQTLATLLHAPLDTLVMVQNATTGLNIVLHNLRFEPGDTILYFSTIYSGCEKSIQFLAEITPASPHRIPLAYPVADATILSRFRAACAEVRAEGRRPRLLIFDTVSSMPGVRQPFMALAAACREEGVLSFVDGAHGAGHIPLDLTALDADFFVSNAHKWLYVPRACAVLYVRRELQEGIRSTMPTSHGFVPKGVAPRASPVDVDDGDTPFVVNFKFVGTLDQTPYACVPAAVAWRKELRWEGKNGEQAVMGYCSALARRAGTRVAEMWGTEVLSNAGCEGQDGTDTLGECCMSNVRLPLDVAAVAAQWNGGDVFATAAKLVPWIGRTSLGYGTMVQTYWHVDAIWWRISAQIFLELKDIEWGARVIKEICERAEKGEWVEQAKSKL